MLNRVDLTLLSLLTFFWGINWPIMKYAVTEFPPLAFRVLSMMIGIVTVLIYLVIRKESFHVPGFERLRLLHLTLGNMLIWHITSIYGLKFLSSGRAAILAYTMPIWAMLASVFLFKGEFTWRSAIGVALALAATVLLGLDELTSMLGKPEGLFLMLFAAMIWGYGTAMMKHRTISISNGLMTFWMMMVTFAVILAGTTAFESHLWRWPHLGEWGAILFNGVVVFGFCHIVWFRLARKLPPVASSLSIMLIPVLGVFSGALALQEKVMVTDLAALGLILTAMGAVLFKRKNQ